MRTIKTRGQHVWFVTTRYEADVIRHACEWRLGELISMLQDEHTTEGRIEAGRVVVCLSDFTKQLANVLGVDETQ